MTTVIVQFSLQSPHTPNSDTWPTSTRKPCSVRSRSVTGSITVGFTSLIDPQPRQTR